jgi:hypothetical protein
MDAQAVRLTARQATNNQQVRWPPKYYQNRMFPRDHFDSACSPVHFVNHQQDLGIYCKRYLALEGRQPTAKISIVQPWVPDQLMVRSR